MKSYDFAKNNYYESKGWINCVLNNKQLSSFIGQDASNLLRFIDQLYVDKLNSTPKKHVAFNKFIIFTGDFVKTHTGMSKYRQSKALNALEKCGLIEINYFTNHRCNHYFKSIRYNYRAFEDFFGALSRHLDYLKNPYLFIENIKHEPLEEDIYNEYDYEEELEETDF